jgi:hypothetical protein
LSGSRSSCGRVRRRRQGLDRDSSQVLRLLPAGTSGVVILALGRGGYGTTGEPQRHLDDVSGEVVVPIDDGRPERLNLIVEIKGWRGEDGWLFDQPMRAHVMRRS